MEEGRSPPQYALDPRDNLMGAGIAGLVEVDDAAADVALDVALQRRRTARDRREVAGADQQFVVIFQEETNCRRVSAIAGRCFALLCTYGNLE